MWTTQSCDIKIIFLISIILGENYGLVKLEIFSWVEINRTSSPVATTSTRYWLTLSFSYNGLSFKLQNSKFYKNTKWSFSLLDCLTSFCSWLSSWCKVVFHLDYLWCIMAHAQDSKIYNSCDNRWVWAFVNTVVPIFSRTTINLNCLKWSSLFQKYYF